MLCIRMQRQSSGLFSRVSGCFGQTLCAELQGTGQDKVPRTKSPGRQGHICQGSENLWMPQAPGFGPGSLEEPWESGLNPHAPPFYLGPPFPTFTAPSRSQLLSMVCLFVVQGTELRVSHLLDKSSTPEPHQSTANALPMREGLQHGGGMQGGSVGCSYKFFWLLSLRSSQHKRETDIIVRTTHHAIRYGS